MKSLKLDSNWLYLNDDASQRYLFVHTSFDPVDIYEIKGELYELFKLILDEQKISAAQTVEALKYPFFEGGSDQGLTLLKTVSLDEIDLNVDVFSSTPDEEQIEAYGRMYDKYYAS